MQISRLMNGKSHRRMRLFPRPPRKAQIRSPSASSKGDVILAEKRIICRGIVQNIAKTIQNNRRSAEITIAFRNQTARKMVTSVHIVGNTSASAVTNGVVKLSNTLKLITHQSRWHDYSFTQRGKFSQAVTRGPVYSTGKF